MARQLESVLVPSAEKRCLTGARSDSEEKFHQQNLAGYREYILVPAKSHRVRRVLHFADAQKRLPLLALRGVAKLMGFDTWS